MEKKQISITCPFCFKTFDHEDVHFRSEKVITEKPDLDAEDNFDDYKKSLENKKKDDIDLTPKEKEALEHLDEKQKEWEEWSLFSERTDAKYDKFWKAHGGNTTEEKPKGELKNIEVKDIPVIDIGNLPDGIESKKIYDKHTGMMIALEVGGQKTDRRVCPHCHNPLPEGYGAYPVKFITVVGITKAGKTVYLSQIIKNFDIYLDKVGLYITKKSASVYNLIKKNSVAVGDKLPESTPAKEFQQPLFFEIQVGITENKIIKETLVLYDIGGELFSDSGSVDIDTYAPFIKHSNGLILLIPYTQFDIMKKVGVIPEVEGEPTKVLDNINDLIHHAGEVRPELPIAVCISKADIFIDKLKEALSDDLINRLMRDLEYHKDENGDYSKEFNAKDYNPIGKALNDFLSAQDDMIARKMKQQYSDYSWFALSALGFNAETELETDENGNEVQVLKGEVIPKHIEDPLLWLFYRFGYIGSNTSVYSPTKSNVVCPDCESSDLELKEGVEVESDIKEEGRGFLDTMLQRLKNMK